MIAVVLASASSRRLDLLAPLGLDITVMPADIDETPHPGEEPVAYVQRLAAEKRDEIAFWSHDLGAEPGSRDQNAMNAMNEVVVIAADTTVDLDGVILGKPTDAAEATAMLAALSGRTHLVHTGVSVGCGTRVATGVASTAVTFVELDERTIAWYVGMGEPFGKAGAYAIQGAGGFFVVSVSGSVSNVIGLPLTLVVELAARVGVGLIASV